MRNWLGLAIKGYLLKIHRVLDFSLRGGNMVDLNRTGILSEGLTANSDLRMLRTVATFAKACTS